MTLLQAIALCLVAVVATAVVLTRNPLKQTVILGIDGLLLSTLFFTFQAPDVALSELVIGAVVLPALILLTLRRIRTEKYE